MALPVLRPNLTISLTSAKSKAFLTSSAYESLCAETSRLSAGSDDSLEGEIVDLDASLSDDDSENGTDIIVLAVTGSTVFARIHFLYPLLLCCNFRNESAYLPRSAAEAVLRARCAEVRFSSLLDQIQFAVSKFPFQGFMIIGSFVVRGGLAPRGRSLRSRISGPRSSSKRGTRSLRERSLSRDLSPCG